METFSIVLVGVIIVISFVWFYNKRGTILHPFAFVAAICFLVQVVAPLDWKISGKRIYRGVPIMDYIVQAELIFLLGYIFFWVGYIISKPKHKVSAETIYRIDKDGCDIDIDKYMAYWMYAFAFLLYVVYMRINGRSLLSQLTLGQRGIYFEDTSSNTSFLFIAISINMLITISCLLLYVDTGFKKYAIYLVTVLLSISSGRRHLMLDIFLAPIIIHYTKKNKKPNILILSFAMVFSYLLVGWIGAMRLVYRYGTGSLTAFDGDSAWDAVMINLEVFMPLCMYIAGLKGFSSYALGSSYVAAFLQLIPSIVFPYKNRIISALSLGSVEKVLGDRFLAEGIAGTFWSLLYANGWIVGVVIGMYFLGKWVKRIELKPTFHRISYLVEYGILTPFMFQFLTRSFGNAIQDLIGLMLPIIVIRHLSKRNYRERMQI